MWLSLHNTCKPSHYAIHLKPTQRPLFNILAILLGMWWYIMVLICTSLITLMLIFSCTYLSFIYILWWNIYANILHILREKWENSCTDIEVSSYSVKRLLLDACFGNIFSVLGLYFHSRTRVFLKAEILHFYELY